MIERLPSEIIYDNWSLSRNVKLGDTVSIPEFGEVIIEDYLFQQDVFVVERNDQV